jgi:hypothetical protein
MVSQIITDVSEESVCFYLKDTLKLDTVTYPSRLQSSWYCHRNLRSRRSILLVGI